MNNSEKVYYRMTVKCANRIMMRNGKLGGNYVTSYHEFGSHEEAQGFKNAMAITTDLHTFQWEQDASWARRNSPQTHSTDVTETAVYEAAYTEAYDAGYYGEEYNEGNSILDYDEYEKAFNEGAADNREDGRVAQCEARHDAIYDPQDTFHEPDRMTWNDVDGRW